MHRKGDYRGKSAIRFVLGQNFRVRRESHSAPFMFWIAALQLLFELRISLAPKDRKIFRYLYRAITWREHLNAHRDAPVSDPNAIFNIEQILNARRERRRPIR